MKADDPRFNDIIECTNNLMIATEPLLSFERKATLRLRGILLSLQRDSQLMFLLLSEYFEQDPSSSTQSTVADEFPNAFDELASTLAKLLENKTLNMIAERLKATNRNLHSPIVTSINNLSLDIEAKGHTFNHAFKMYWLPPFLSSKSFREKYMTAGISGENSSLWSAFRHRPFGIGFSNDGFIENTPRDRENILSLDSYQISMREAGASWAKDCMGANPDLDAEPTIQQDIIRLFWGGGMDVLNRVDMRPFTQTDASFDDMNQSRDRLSNSLRDSLLRNHSKLFSMVFVGAEDSGKSTFLNSFVGIDVLPAASGPTTSYPVRIRHSPGQIVPNMQLGTATLEDHLKSLKKAKWHERVTGLLGGTWRGKGFPVGYDFPGLKERWQHLDSTLVERLRELTEPEFTFPAMVSGAENIKITLRHVNDFVRICRNLPIGFDHFAPEEWPIITLEFPSLKNTYTAGDLEVIDIPGFDGYNQEYEWDETIREVIRRSNVLIAVVSLRQYEFTTWRNLPQFIASCTNVRPSAVVATMRDYGGFSDDEISVQVDFIRSVFWPGEEDNVYTRPVLVCSAKFGAAMREMENFLAGFDEKPEWGSFWDPIREEGSVLLFPSRMHHVYEKATIETLRKKVADILNLSGLLDAIDSLTRIGKTARQRSLVDESKGIIMQSKRIGFDLRRMLAAVGKAHGDVNTPTSEQERAESDDAMELLDTWNLRKSNFSTKIRTLFTSNSADMVSQVVKCVDGAIMDADAQEFPGTELSEYVQFSTRENIDHYIRQYELSVSRRVELAERAKVSEMLEEISRLHRSLFAQLRTRVLQIDPSLEEHWPEMMKEEGIPLSLLPLSPKADIIDFVQELRTKYSPIAAFAFVERVILRLVFKTDSPAERLKTLHVGSRLLVAMASTLPFIVALPYWLRKSSIEAYKLNMDTLRRHLVRLAKAHSDDVFSQLEEELLVQAQLESEAALNAIYSTFSVPQGYQASLALPEVPLSQLQMVTAAMADILALNSALDLLCSSATRKSEVPNILAPVTI